MNQLADILELFRIDDSVTTGRVIEVDESLSGASTANSLNNLFQLSYVI